MSEGPEMPYKEIRIYEDGRLSDGYGMTLNGWQSRALADIAKAAAEQRVAADEFFRAMEPQPVGYPSKSAGGL